MARTPTAKPTTAAPRSAGAVLVDLAAPVGELGDATAQGLDRAAELVALEVDVATDLGRRARGTRSGLAGSTRGLICRSL